MKKIKLQFLKIYSILLAAILAIMGISSSCIKVEYGTPSAKFIANGRIQSADSSKSIEGIQVIFGQWDTVYSDQYGNYSAFNIGYPEEQYLLIEFKDVDGSLNGEYKGKDTLVEFDNPDFGSNAWTGPDTERIVNVKLEKK